MAVNKCWSYLRLSRDDAETPGLLQEKFARQKATALELAKRYDLDLPEENILVEQESGTSLKNRPLLRRLIDLMNAGLCTHIISPARDRLDRLHNKREQADFEDALYNGKVTLVTLEGVTTYNDDLDTVPEEFRALVARLEAKMYSKRLREANRQRLRKNQRTGSYPPYGYRRNREAPGGMEIVPAEYAVLEEIFRRILAGESIRSLLKWLNDAQVPVSSMTRRVSVGAKWNYSTLRHMISNPIYAGYNAKTTHGAFGKKRRPLNPDDFVFAEEGPGPWPHPITLADWHSIRARYIAYRASAYPRSALLTGILYCPEGSSMRASSAGQSYGCTCPKSAGRHYCHRPLLGQAVLAAVADLIDGMPDRIFEAESRPLRDKGVLHDQLNRAARALRQAEADMSALAADGERLRRLMGDMPYDTVLSRAGREWERLNQEFADLREAVIQPDMDEAVTLLQALRERGAARVLKTASVTEQRAILRTVIRRVTLVSRSRPGAYFKKAVIEWQPWIAEKGMKPPGVVEWRRQSRVEE